MDAHQNTSNRHPRAVPDQDGNASGMKLRFLHLTWCASLIVVSVTMTRFFCLTHAAKASGPLASSTDLAVSAAAGAGSRLDRSGRAGGVVVIPGGARPLCAERSPWTACSARKTASLEGAVEGLGGLDLLSRERASERASG